MPYSGKNNVDPLLRSLESKIDFLLVHCRNLEKENSTLRREQAKMNQEYNDVSSAKKLVRNKLLTINGKLRLLQDKF